LNSVKIRHIGVCIAALLLGCNWDPPHDNPIDPNYYRYLPTGELKLTVIGADSLKPLSQVEVRSPALAVLAYTDSAGSVHLKKLPLGLYRFYAERRDGTKPYGLDSVNVQIRENSVYADTLSLPPLPPTRGGLTVRVKTLISQEPIYGAEIRIPELGLYSLSNPDGYAEFPEVRPGNWTITGSKLSAVPPSYAVDSLQVTINPSSLTSVVLNLDALPFFIEVLVTSLSKYRGVEEYTRELRLKAKVDDPDRTSDIEHIEWTYRDTLETEIVVSGYLSYNQDSDSAFWETTIAADRLPEGNIDRAVSKPFRFEAFDQSGNSAVTTAALAKVIHRAPSLVPVEISWIEYPKLVWRYYWRDEFEDESLFKYILRVQDVDNNLSVVYDTLLAQAGESQPSHTLVRPLVQGDYYWRVWVVDLYGNLSQSQRGRIVLQ